MPIFRFECDKCGDIFEKICFNINTEKEECPKCSTFSKKIISVVNFKIDKYAYKPLKKSKPKSYIPNLHDLKLDPESKKKMQKEVGKDLIIK